MATKESIIDLNRDLKLISVTANTSKQNLNVNELKLWLETLKRQLKVGEGEQALSLL